MFNKILRGIAYLTYWIDKRDAHKHNILGWAIELLPITIVLTVPTLALIYTITGRDYYELFLSYTGIGHGGEANLYIITAILCTFLFLVTGLYLFYNKKTLYKMRDQIEQIHLSQKKVYNLRVAITFACIAIYFIIGTLSYLWMPYLKDILGIR